MEKNPVGRPTLFKDEYITQAIKLCKLGADINTLCDFFGVVKDTIYKWMKKNKDFADAVNKGREDHDKEVERALCERAKGYTVKEVRTYLNKEGEIIEKEVKKEFPPDPTSCIFWLTNRNPGKWRKNGGADDDHKAEPVQVVINVQDASKEMIDVEADEVNDEE